MPKCMQTRRGTGCPPEEGESIFFFFFFCSQGVTIAKTLFSGAGNMHHRTSDNSHSPAPDERGRDAHKGGVLGNVLRSFSRAAGRDKSSEGRAKD